MGATAEAVRIIFAQSVSQALKASKRYFALKPMEIGSPLYFMLILSFILPRAVVQLMDKVSPLNSQRIGHLFFSFIISMERSSISIISR